MSERPGPPTPTATGPANAVDTAPGQGTDRPRRSLPPSAATVLALVLFLALALAAMWPGLFTGHDTIVGNAGDPSLSIWCLQWVPFALSHHLNPFVTDYLNYPSGANLMWNTSILFPALVLTPVTDLWGPIVSYNALAVLGMSLSGWCAFLAVRRFSRRWISAWVGGVLYEFSPFMVVQITGHAQLFVAVFPPLLLLFGDEILVRQRRPAALMGALLGFAAAAQLLTGSELLAISVLMAVPTLITLAVIFRARLRERLLYMLRAAGFAAATFAVLAAYPLYIQFLGPDRAHGALEGFGFVARPTSFLIPSSFELLRGPSTVFDSSVYIGIPLFILAVAVTVRMRRRAAVVASAVTLGCAMVLALGGHLIIHGPPTRIPLPWLVPARLPVLEDLLPVRLMIAGYLALAVMVAVFLDRVVVAPMRLRIAGLAAAAVALVPLIPTLPISSGQYSIPAFFTDGATQGLAPTGSVLMTPYGDTPFRDDPPEVWQAVSGMAFKTQMGLLYAPEAGGRQVGPALDPLGEELSALGNGAVATVTLSASQREVYLSDMRAHGVDAIVVGPSATEDQEVQFFTELTGQRGESTGGVVVWFDVHP
jgi:hypothetical protein